MRKYRRWMRTFTLEGLNTERFVHQAGERKLLLTDLRRSGPRRLTAAAREDDLPALRELAASGGWRLIPGRRHGAGRAAEWLRTRWLLCAAAAMALLLMAAASQIVWRIEIVDGGTYEADIRTTLTELGVTVPVWRGRIDVGSIRDALEWRYPRIAWVECGLRGVSLVVRPVEGVLPLTDAEEGPCDVIAGRDAVIHSIVTRAGTPVVKPGDIVRAGDVLIRGEERTSDGLTHPVAARGTVTGRVWVGASVRMSAVEAVTAYTGNTQTVWTVRTPWFDLWRLPDCDYAHADIAVTEMPLGGFLLPFTLHIETRMEAEIALQDRDLTAVREEAYAAAVRRLHEKVGETESLIDIWGNCSMIDDENVLSYAVGEMLVDIGQRAPSGMAAPE